MKKTYIRILLGVALCVMAAAPALSGPLATLETGAAGVEWRPTASDVGLALTVSGPEGFYWRQEFAPGESPAFSVFDAAGVYRPSGVYVWELRPVRQLDPATTADLASAREAGDEVVVRKAIGPSAAGGYASGSFSILNGQVVAGGSDELAPAASGDGNRLATKVVLTNANGVIRNALCVGADCPDAPAFGDSSVLMMENNNRIKFGDTSASPFPNNDWEIEANSSVSGGQSYLGFNDCGTADNDGDCATDLVFAVEAGARASALYVESDGDVGLGTASPVLDLHIVTGNTPALRLEQDASSGFTAQTWDVAGNEASFFIRDVTSGSTLPFRIRPGASSNSLAIDSDSDVGVGILSPAEDLHVFGTDGATKLLVEEASGTATGRQMMELRNNGNVNFILVNTAASGEDWQILAESSGTFPGFSISRQGSGVRELYLTDTGDLEITGEIFTAGSCSGGCDLVFSPDYELPSIEEHAAEMFTNRHLPAVGPTSEDGPFNLSQMAGGMLNELEKAHIYIAQLSEEKKRLEDELRAEIEALKAALEEIAER